MTIEAATAAALESLTGTRHVYDAAAELVPDEPGLYAFYGDGAAWSSLDLRPNFPDQPLYVGKAERSLNGRDVRTHFAAGKTGSSTVRRSLAALLDRGLGLVPVPRNTAKPDGSANFALDPASEAKLSEWMRHRLALATWSRIGEESLGVIETEVIRQLRPPLNLNKVGEPRAQLRAARRRMADIARAWQPTPAQDAKASRTSPPTA
jgi:hypothetical protein